MGKADRYLKHWQGHRTALHELLELFTDEHLPFQPWDGAIPLGAMAVHIATSMDMFVEMVKTGESVTAAKEPFETMEDVRRIVHRYTEKTKDDLVTLTEDQLERVCTFGSYQAPGKSWIRIAIDHEIHHKGQLFVYARMAGLERLPFFLVQPPKTVTGGQP